MPRTALALCACLIAAAPLTAAEPERPDERPNIVFVLIDDLGYGDLGVYGNPDIKTPHIDRLAAEGTRFTQFTVGSPICSASRVALTTGQFPARHRIHSYLASRQRNRERGMADFLDPEAPSIARAFQSAGYATAHFGKWHMGGGRDVDDAPLPKAYGFDESLVSFEGLGDRVLPPGGLSRQSAQLGHGKVTHAPKHKLTETYVDRAIGFLREHKSEPVYLHLWLNDVHDPFAPTDEQLKKFEGSKKLGGNKYRQQYAAVLDEVDRQVGRLVKAIDEMGLGERTLIVFSADNGPTAWPHYAKEGLDAPGRTGALRGRKWSLYEGGIREPLIVRQPGKVKAGRVDETTIISAADLFPTFCRLAGVEPPDVEFDGVDMSRALLGESVERERPLFWEYGRDATYLRPAEPIDVSPNLAIREGRWKLLMNADRSRLELYDLGESPKEYFNVAGRHPDVRDRLAEKLLAWKDTLPNYPDDAATRLGKSETAALKAGQSLPTNRAPRTAEAEITVEAVVTTDGKNGVIVAHGGQAAGYALTIEDGKAKWTVRTRGEAFSVTSPEPLPASKVSLKARLAADGALTLAVGEDDKEPARGKASQLLPAPPVDPLDVGFDGRGNVGDYKDDFRFGGTIHEVSVTTRPVERDTFGHMVTRWAGDVDPSSPLPEYPRPQMRRERWQNLNGHWQYAIRPKDDNQPEKWDGRILVPFPVESLLSGVQKRVGEANRLWYRRTFQVPDDWNEDRLLLHFGAVDWETDVWVNGKHVGRHRGGYDPFSFDVTDALSDEDEQSQELVVAVWDPSDAGPQPRGKQVRDPEGIWYTPVTGIWQTAWIEPVPQIYIKSLEIQTFLDTGEVDIGLNLSEREPRTQTRVEIRDADGNLVYRETVSEDGFTPVIDKPHLWSPESPHLYTLRAELASGDAIESYFGMREVALQKDEAGHERLLLNGEPVFHLGPLDQGWWPDGLYTAPTDEALRFDIEMTKRYGFNMARKHVKVEPARWYYWADKLGLLVWQDMPSGMQGGGRGPNHVMKGQPDLELPEEAKQIFRTELKAMIDALHNHPSIVVWVPFNEGWGQYDTNEILKWTKDYDPTRLVDGPSGWEDRGYGEMIDLHSYPGPDIPMATEGRAAVLGEFGGLGLPVRGHTWVTRNNWGYRTYDNREALHRAYRELFEQLPALIDRGLAAAIYTQTTDVEVEVNGLMTYDRSVYKFDPDEFRELHEKVIEQGSTSDR